MYQAANLIVQTFLCMWNLSGSSNLNFIVALHPTKPRSVPVYEADTILSLLRKIKHPTLIYQEIIIETRI